MSVSGLRSASNDPYFLSGTSESGFRVSNASAFGIKRTQLLRGPFRLAFDLAKPSINEQDSREKSATAMATREFHYFSFVQFRKARFTAGAKFSVVPSYRLVVQETR